MSRSNTQSFDSFVTYEGNHLAYAAMYEVASNPDKPLSPLYIYSKPGLGKTHLVNAAAEIIAESGKVSYIIVTTAERFRNDYIYALRKQMLPDYYAKYECADLIIMEHFQHLSSCQEMQQIFHEIFDLLQEKGKQIILTADVPPAHLIDFDKSLLSKISAGYVIEIEAPKYDDRIAILEDEMQSVLDKRKIAVDEDDLDEIFSIIANSETEDIRQMKGWLTRVIGFATLLDEEINMAFAEKILRSLNK